MPRSSSRWLLIVMGIAALATAPACSFQRDADAKFGDQNFKTAVALIELYHVRHGVYPETLKDLDFTGDWDAIGLSAVRYERLPDGYALDLTRGWVGKPALAYPDAFWHGLGVRRTNVAHSPPAS